MSMNYYACRKQHVSRFAAAHRRPWKKLELTDSNEAKLSPDK